MNSRLNRSLSRNKEEQDSSIIRSNTASNLTEQAKPDELVSGKHQRQRWVISSTRETYFLGLATMGLLNDDDMNKVIELGLDVPFVNWVPALALLVEHDFRIYRIIVWIRWTEQC